MRFGRCKLRLLYRPIPFPRKMKIFLALLAALSAAAITFIALIAAVSQLEPSIVYLIPFVVPVFVFVYTLRHFLKKKGHNTVQEKSAVIKTEDQTDLSDKLERPTTNEDLTMNTTRLKMRVFWIAFKKVFGERPAKVTHYRKANGSFKAFAPFNPERLEFCLVGLSHENRRDYIRAHAEKIEQEAVISRKEALDKDKNAVALVHNGKVCGFISRDYAPFVAKLLDRKGDEIVVNTHVWIGSSSEAIYLNFQATTKSAKQELQKMLLKCIDLTMLSEAD